MLHTKQNVKHFFFCFATMFLKAMPYPHVICLAIPCLENCHYCFLTFDSSRVWIQHPNLRIVCKEKANQLIPNWQCMNTLYMHSIAVVLCLQLQYHVLHISVLTLISSGSRLCSLQAEVILLFRLDRERLRSSSSSYTSAAISSCRGPPACKN